MSYTYDANVAKQQADLNKANAGKSGYIPLTVDGFLGPKTQAAIQQYGFNPQTGLPNNSNTLNSDNLKSSNPYILPNNSTLNYGGMPGAMESSLSQAQKDLETAKKTSETSLQAYMDSLMEQGGISSSVNREEQDAAKKKYDAFTSQLEQEQLANRRTVENIQKNNPGGMLRGGQMDLMNNIQRDSLSKQADIAILQNAAGRNYETAASIADRQVALKLEQSQTKMAVLKTFYEANKADFDKADERLYQEAIKKSDAELKTKTNNENSIKEIKLTAAQNGASISVLNALSAIDTTKPDAFDEAIKAAGSSLATSSNDFVKLANGSTVLVNKTTGKVIKNLGGGTSTNRGGTSTNTGMPGSVVSTVKTSDGKTTPITGYILQAGNDPYDIAQANGTDMTILQKLNPNITDWTTLQPGQVINLPDVTNSWLKGKTDVQIAAYNSIPDTEKDSVKQLINGDALLADLMRSRGIQGTTQIQKLINQATSIDPTFSVNTNKIRYEFQKQFTTDSLKGAVGSQNAINTALGHLSDLKTLSSELPQKSLNKLNSIQNILYKETGDPTVINFRIALSALGAELARVYTGGVPEEGEKKAWRENLAASFSKSQFQGATDTTAKLLSSKITALRYQYKKAMGKEYSQTLIDPEKRQMLLDAGIDPNSIVQENTGNGVVSYQNQLDNTTLSSYGLGNTAINNILNQYGL